MEKDETATYAKLLYQGLLTVTMRRYMGLHYPDCVQVDNILPQRPFQGTATNPDPRKRGWESRGHKKKYP